MANKKQEPPFIVGRYPDESEAAAEARAALRPSTQGALTFLGVNPLRSNSVRDVNALAAELEQQAKSVSSNNLARLEAMLTVQAHTLDAMFNDMARRAALNRRDYLDAFERYMRLALKAQSQCRATIESLAEIKNPTGATFVRQANIAQGPQQVNNGEVKALRAEKLEVVPNKLLEQTHGERLDSGATGQAVGSDPVLAAVGAIDRAAHG